MDALLGLAFGGDLRGKQSCQSVDEIKHELQTTISTKCTEKRVEHISKSFDFQRHTTFLLAAHVEDGQDPVTQLQHEGVTRTVTTSEAVDRQPSDDPALQKDIAKHIVAQISTADGTSWVVREVGRSSQGWTFTYICKESMQAWTRATAKTPSKHLIAEWTGPGGLDDFNAVRPAFDCRGTLSIAFSKTNRAIIIRYEHSPLHKTVSQLMDILAPTRIPPVPPAKEKNSNPNKTPRPQKPRRWEAAADVEGVEGTESTTKKKKKRPLPVEGEDSTPAKKKRPRKSKGTAAAEAIAEYPTTTTTAEISASAEVNGTENAQATYASTTNFTPLNVPPAEAERRKEAAVRLLAGRGIDPATLTTEQLNIFANQAPQLQETSLQMFALYGAERLRIVHPNDTADETSASPAPPPASVPVDPDLGGDNMTTEDTGHTAQVSIGAGAVVDVEENGAVGTTSTTLQPSGVRKTRGACEVCKKKKTKCPKEQPKCSNCVKSGVDCVYAPVKPRRKSEKVVSEAEAVSDQEDERDTALNQAQELAADDSINYSNVDPSRQTSQPDHFSENPAQPQQDRLSFNQIGYVQQPQMQYTTALDAVRQALNTPNHTATTSATRTTAQHERVTQKTSPVTQAPAEPYKLAGNRHRLPIAQAAQQTPVQPPHVPAQQSAPRSAMSANANITPSPTMLARQIGQRPRAEKSATTASQMSPKVAQGSAYAQPRRQPQTSHSPHQTGHVALAQATRTHVPVPDVYRGAQNTSPALSQSTTATMGYSGNSTTSGASRQDYSRHGNARTNRYSTTARTSPQTTTSTMATSTPSTTSASGLPLPPYSTQVDPYQGPSSVANTAPANQSAASRRKRSPPSSQWAAHNAAASSTTSTYSTNNNYSMPSTHSTSSYGIDSSVPATNSTGNSAVYNSTQPSYSSYGSQQMPGTSNSQTQPQQHWYGNNSATPFASSDRTAAYPPAAASNNSDHMSSFQGGSDRNSSVGGYGGHVYDMAGDGNMYDLFQGNRQH